MISSTIVIIIMSCGVDGTDLLPYVEAEIGDEDKIMNGYVREITESIESEPNPERKIDTLLDLRNTYMRMMGSDMTQEGMNRIHHLDRMIEDLRGGQETLGK